MATPGTHSGIVHVYIHIAHAFDLLLYFYVSYLQQSVPIQISNSHFERSNDILNLLHYITKFGKVLCPVSSKRGTTIIMYVGVKI